jgi:hypothetical protein
MNKRPLLLDKADARKFVLAVGVGTWAMALVEFISPRPESPTGRWSWLTAPIYDSFGAHGLAALWFAIGCFMIIISQKKDD